MPRLLMLAAVATSLCVQLSGCGGNSPDDIVKVYKSDQSKQCENSGIAAEIMRKELLAAGIDVLCTQKDHDGMMQASVCGGNTGAINVYLIHAENFADAQALGYAPVSELPAYQDKICEE